MKVGDKIVYVGETTKNIKKYSVCELILVYDDNRYLTCYNSEFGFNTDYDEDKILIIEKELFMTLADYRKQKLEKIKFL